MATAEGSHSSIERLALALFHRELWSANFMVMTAYLDESGTHGKQSPTVIIAGFIADVAGWAGYERELGNLLTDYGIKVFHAKNSVPEQENFAAGLKSGKLSSMHNFSN